MDGRGGGASVVVRARESRVHGEGRQGVDQLQRRRNDPWTRIIRPNRLGSSAFSGSCISGVGKTPTEPYRDLWNWVTDPRNLRCAWRSIATNKGKRTSGVDGETVESIVSRLGVDAFLDGLRNELRQRSYCPSPARRVWIPKRGKPGKFRPLGIPTVADRVVQCAVKQVLEPIFEARFWHVSYGFRPGRGCHGALEHIRQTIMPRNKVEADGKRHAAPYQWVIEGDIEGCFDNIDHHLLMNRVRRAVADRRVNRLIVGFLKAGVLEDFIYSPSSASGFRAGCQFFDLYNFSSCGITVV